MTTSMKSESELIPIPHKGRKPDWLEDDATIWFIGTHMVSYGQARLVAWLGQTLALSPDHWAAPVLRAGLTPWNPKLQGDGPPPDWRPGCAVIYALDAPYLHYPSAWVDVRMTEVGDDRPIGYEPAPAASRLVPQSLCRARPAKPSPKSASQREISHERE